MSLLHSIIGTYMLSSAELFLSLYRSSSQSVVRDKEILQVRVRNGEADEMADIYK